MIRYIGVFLDVLTNPKLSANFPHALRFNFALSSRHVSHIVTLSRRIQSTHFCPIAQRSILIFSCAHPYLPTAILSFLYSLTQ